jgi:methyl-accepting chemotaxis protein
MAARYSGESKSLANARQGNEAVQGTIQGMVRIRDQVQETAKRL